MLRWYLVAVVLFVAGCDSNPSEPVVDPPAFHAGQRWVYVYDAVMRDSLGGVMNAYHDSLEVVVASVTDTLFGMGGLVRMEARSLLPWFGPGPAPGAAMHWYASTATALVERAYRNPGAAPIVMLSVGGERRAFRVGTFFEPLRSILPESASDTTIQRDDPRTVLRFPLRKGVAWDAFWFPFHQRREVTDVEVIRVLGRDMRAARIRTTMPEMDPAFEWDDWVSPNGLLQREMRVTLEAIDMNLNPVGRYTHTETTTLVALE